MQVRRFLRYLAPLHILRGFCIGCADLVPGVSGGTMALILGIYARLITALGGFTSEVLPALLQRRFREAARAADILFLLHLFAGVVCAALFFTRIVDLPGLLVSHPREVYGFFFGLVASSFVLLLADTAKQTRPGAPAALCVALIAGGFYAGFSVISSAPAAVTPETWRLLPAGAAASAAMLLPGISGSFILLIIGQYGHALGAVQEGDITKIAVFLAGVLCGLALMSRVIFAALRRFPAQTYALMAGLLAGCAPALWPFQQRFYYHYAAEKNVLLSDLYLPAFSAPDNGVILALLAAGLALPAVLHFAVSALCCHKGCYKTEHTE